MLLLGACDRDPLLDSIIPAAVSADASAAIDAPPLPPPPTVIGVQLEAGDGEVVVTWQADLTAPVAGFELLVSVGAAGPDSRWVAGETSARIAPLENDVPVTVAVRAVDASGFPGPASAAATATPSFDPTSVVRVPSGEFLGGVREYGGELYVAWLDTFIIDRYPATNARYAECVDAGACLAPVASWGWVGGAAVADALHDPATALHPVTFLSWDMARAYCAWRGLRLPLAAERQKAARGPAPGDGVWPWGDAAPSCSLASYAQGGAFCTAGTEPVGTHPAAASPLGVHDLAGGVWEWIEDGPGDGTHALAGGAWYAEPALMAVGRIVLSPGDIAAPVDPQLDYRGYGVRCAGPP